MRALLLAGRPNTGRLRGADGAAWEALIPVAGKPMALWVAEALRGCAAVDAVWVVGPPELGELVPWASLVSPAATLLENLERGLAAMGGEGDEGVLVVGGDVPLVTSGEVASFLLACARRPADVHYPVVRREACLGRYPGARRTWARLREGTFTGGNAFLLRRSAVPVLLGLLDRFYAARKSPARLALLLGPGLLFRYVLGLLSVTAVEARFHRLTGLVGRAVELPEPGLAMDVDRPEDLALVRRVLARAS